MYTQLKSPTLLALAQHRERRSVLLCREHDRIPLARDALLTARLGRRHRGLHGKSHAKEQVSRYDDVPRRLSHHVPARGVTRLVHQVRVLAVCGGLEGEVEGEVEGDVEGEVEGEVEG